MSQLITATELASKLDDPNLLVVDCRFDLAKPDWGSAEFAQRHIEGAIYAHLNDELSSPITVQSGRHPLPTAAAFAATLQRWGIAERTQVVAYDQGNGAFASRLWWLLRAVGHEAVQVLDGGLAAWKAAGLQLTTVVRERKPSALPIREFRDWLSTSQLEQALAEKSIKLADARSPERFYGRQEPIDPVAGHVPGAVNHPLTDNLEADGRFLPAETLRERWLRTLAGQSPQTLVAMCGSGITACHNLLALEVAGLPGGRLYAGSWSEWIRDPQRLVATLEP